MKKILYSLLTMCSSLFSMDNGQKKAEERFLATYQERARLSLPTILQNRATVAKASLQAAELLDRYKAVYARAAYALCKERVAYHQPLAVLLDLDVYFPKQDHYEEIVHGKVLRSWFTRMISNSSYKSQWLSQLSTISTLVYGYQATQTW